MGGGSSVPISESKYLYGEPQPQPQPTPPVHASSPGGHSKKTDATNNGGNGGPDWIGTSIQLPPKPFALQTYFDVVRVIGTGMIGKVSLVQHKKTKKYFALKSMKKQQIMESHMLSYVVDEKLALEKLKHPFLIGYFGSFQSSHRVFLLLEYAVGGDLFHLLDKHRVFSNDQAKFYASEMVVALEYFHTHGYMYRDLKPENILLDAHGHIKIADLGFCKPLDAPDGKGGAGRKSSIGSGPMSKPGKATSPKNARDQPDNDEDEVLSNHSTQENGGSAQRHASVGTVPYLSPELLTSGKRRHEQCLYSFEVDWWAFACVVYEMVTGKTPFCRDKNDKDSQYEIYTRVLSGKVLWPRHMNKQLKELLKQMLDPKLEKRLIQVDKIKSHKWFEQVDWESVSKRQILAPFVPSVEQPGDAQNFDKYPDSGDSDSGGSPCGKHPGRPSGARSTYISEFLSF